MAQNLSFKTTFNAKQITDELIDKRVVVLERAMKAAEREIHKRTQRAEDYTGKKFKEYCPEYKDWKNGVSSAASARWSNFMEKVGGNSKLQKARKPRKRKDGTFKPGRGDVVNLTLSGDMLGGIDSNVTRSGFSLIGRIFFKTPHQAQKAIWNSATRDFFKLSVSQIEAIKNKLK